MPRRTHKLWAGDLISKVSRCAAAADETMAIVREDCQAANADHT